MTTVDGNKTATCEVTVTAPEYTVTFAPDAGAVHDAGGQPVTQIIVPSGTAYYASENIITIGGTEYTAEPDSGYEFNSFAIDLEIIKKGTITANTTITVNFAESQP
ncbi:MAG: hypothetical protein Q4D99_04280 [Bacillota bacterium]|nr:hypothetical protein [Bacillota bacterium]